MTSQDASHQHHFNTKTLQEKTTPPGRHSGASRWLGFGASSLFSGAADEPLQLLTIIQGFDIQLSARPNEYSRLHEKVATG